MLRCPLLHGIVPGICTNCNGKQIDAFTGGPHYKKAAKDQAMKKATKRAGQAMQALDSNNPAFAGQLQLVSGSKPTLALGNHLESSFLGGYELVQGGEKKSSNKSGRHSTAVATGQESPQHSSRNNTAAAISQQPQQHCSSHSTATAQQQQQQHSGRLAAHAEAQQLEAQDAGKDDPEAHLTGSRTH
ncbi:hypothetical protein ACLKA6_017639 [Drosophila palustris]